MKKEYVLHSFQHILCDPKLSRATLSRAFLQDTTSNNSPHGISHQWWEYTARWRWPVDWLFCDSFHHQAVAKETKTTTNSDKENGFMQVCVLTWRCEKHSWTVDRFSLRLCSQFDDSRNLNNESTRKGESRGRTYGGSRYQAGMPRC